MTRVNTAGKAWIFGDDVDTDVLAPGLYMKGSLEDLARHCLEAIDPDFAANVEEGDTVVAGANFGVGSSREQAAQVLRYLGIRALVAKSFGGIFFRNASNFGLVAVTCADTDRVQPGDEITVDAGAGVINNITRNQIYNCDPLPSQLLEMIADGGLVSHLEKKLTQTKGAE